MVNASILRKWEHNAPLEERPTLRLRRDYLRAAILQEEGIDIVHWMSEEDTAVHQIPSDAELVRHRNVDTRPQICKSCRDNYVTYPQDFFCGPCSDKKIDQGWE